jgi:hypothetical protein
MTIFQAPEYDPRKARRRKIIVSVVIVAVLVIGIFAWLNRHWYDEHVVGKFFQALVSKDYKTAYGIRINDPEWQKHPPLTRYPFEDFYRDWGPAGDWGPIHSYHIDGSSVPHDRNTSANGVVVIVTVNSRAEPATIFVDNKHALSFSPFEVVQ